MPEIATVVARDGDAGTWHEVPVIVRKRFTIEIDCGCWRHQSRDGSTFRMEFIITAGGVYMRPADSNQHFREASRVGPIAACVTEQNRME